jgi:uncharacterized membrane protein
MTNRPRIVVARMLAAVAAFVAAATPTITAAAPVFRGLGVVNGSANAVSADGSTVVGTMYGAGGASEAFRWTLATGIQCLGSAPSGASAVSADGSIVVGAGSDGVLIADGSGAAADQAYRWSTQPRLAAQPLGGLPAFSSSVSRSRAVARGFTDGGGTGQTYSLSYASGVSADGSIVIGDSGNYAFRWTAETGMQPLFEGVSSSSASAISGDGSTVVGYTNPNDLPQEAFRWTVAGGIQRLGFLPNALLYPRSYSYAKAVSRDGSTVVGYAEGNDKGRAVRWNAAGGIEDLGVLPGDVGSYALGVSADGSTVVGGSSPGGPGYHEAAFLWNSTAGMRSLQDILVNDCGLNLQGWTLFNAEGISADGLTIVGNGLNPAGQSEPWIAVVPEPSGVVSLLALAGALVPRRRRRLPAF